MRLGCHEVPGGGQVTDARRDLRRPGLPGPPRRCARGCGRWCSGGVVGARLYGSTRLTSTSPSSTAILRPRQGGRSRQGANRAGRLPVSILAWLGRHLTRRQAQMSATPRQDTDVDVGLDGREVRGGEIHARRGRQRATRPRREALRSSNAGQLLTPASRHRLRAARTEP